MTWKPSVTVAAVMERDGRFLLIEEEQEDGGEPVYNQPAGTDHALHLGRDGG